MFSNDLRVLEVYGVRSSIGSDTTAFTLSLTLANLLRPSVTMVSELSQTWSRITRT